MAPVAIHYPGLRLRQQAILLHRMTGDAAITLEWVTRRQAQQVAGHAGVCPIIDEAALFRWGDEVAGNAEYDAATRDPLHPWRQKLQWFIVEHDVAAALRAQHTKGFRVPAWFVTSAVLRKWTALPQNEATRRRIERIGQGGTTAKNFMRLFRSAWNFRWGPGDTRRSVDAAAANQRAAVFLRWCAWVRSLWPAGIRVVCINMDETRISSVREWATGLVPAPAGAVGSEWPTHRGHPACPRTSLIATICTDPNLQKKLPQIWMPRSRGVPSPQLERGACMLPRAGHRSSGSEPRVA